MIPIWQGQWAIKYDFWLSLCEICACTDSGHCVWVLCWCEDQELDAMGRETQGNMEIPQQASLLTFPLKYIFLYSNFHWSPHTHIHIHVHTHMQCPLLQDSGTNSGHIALWLPGAPPHYGWETCPAGWTSWDRQNLSGPRSVAETGSCSVQPTHHQPLCTGIQCIYVTMYMCVNVLYTQERTNDLNFNLAKMLEICKYCTKDFSSMLFFENNAHAAVTQEIIFWVALKLKTTKTLLYVYTYYVCFSLHRLPPTMCKKSLRAKWRRELRVSWWWHTLVLVSVYLYVWLESICTVNGKKLLCYLLELKFQLTLANLWPPRMCTLKLHSYKFLAFFLFW